MIQVPPLLRDLHKNLQRLVSLGLSISSADVAKPATAGKLANKYKELLTKKVFVTAPEMGRIVRFLQERSLLSKYGASTIADLKERLSRPGATVELQDWYLSDPTLPSHTGGERDQSYLKTIQAAAELGLLHARTLTLTSYGLLLIHLARELGLFEGKLEQRNPFLPEFRFVTAAYFRVVTYDFPMQRQLLGHIASRLLNSRPLSFQDLSEDTPDILETLLRADVPNAPAFRSIRAWLSKELTAARKLVGRVKSSGWKDSSGPTMQTLYRPFEDLLQPRLEFLVDVGALEKPDPFRYIYAPGPGFQPLTNLIANGPGGVRAGFFRFMSEASSRTGAELLGPEDILMHLLPSHRKLRSRTGYAPILETTIMANLQSSGDTPWRFIELDSCLEALRTLSLLDPPRVRLIADRFRNPASFAIGEV